MPEQKEPKAMSLLNWMVLLTSCSVLVVILSLIGGAFILPAAAWSDGLIWGIITTIGFFAALRISRVQSDLVLLLTLLLFILVFIGSQLVYYDDRVSLLQLTLHSADNDLPQHWQQLDTHAAYQTQIRHVLNQAEAGGWFDHLKTQASIGVIRYERQPRTDRHLVVRQGLYMWLGWASIYFFLAIGCFLGMAGGVPKTKDDETGTDTELAEPLPVATSALDSSISSSETSTTTSPSTHKGREPLQQTITKHYGDIDSGLVQVLSQDIALLKHWPESNDKASLLDDARQQKIVELNRRYYGNTIESVEHLAPFHFLLLIADRVSNIARSKFDYQAHQQAWMLLNDLKLGMTLPPLNTLDLDHIKFRKLSAGPRWQDLCTTEFVCYKKDSSWALLNKMEPLNIPESAYLGILNQAVCTDPGDKRLYEGEGSGMNWPFDIIDKTGPAMRDAILYFISDDTVPVKPLTIDNKQLLLSRFAQWEYQHAAPILERCIKAGWIKTLERLAETEQWLSFLDGLHPSPFGDPYLSWYIGHLRRQGKY